MTGTRVNMLAPRAVKAFRADAVRHAGAPGRRSTDPGVEAGTGGAAGGEAGFADGASVAGGAEALEGAVAGVEAQSAVATWSTVAGVGSILASVARESGMTNTLR